MKKYLWLLILVLMGSGVSANANGHYCKGNDSLLPNPGTPHEFTDVKMEGNQIEFSLDGIPFYGVVGSPGLLRGKGPISYLISYCVSAKPISSCNTESVLRSIDLMTFSFTGNWARDRLFSVNAKNFYVRCETE